MIPLAKIVCTFRDPVERVLSLYRLKLAYGWISWTLEDALWRDPELMESSRYAAHLREWIRMFGQSQVMATVHEDMETDPQGYLDKIADFVGAARLKLQPKHLQRARNLLAVVGESRQLGTLRVIAEKSVEHLLDMTQVGLDFARDLRQQQPLLRATRHFVEERRRSRAGDRFVLLRSIEPRDHRLDLLREIG